MRARRVVRADGVVIEEKPFTGKLITQFPVEKIQGTRQQAMTAEWQRNGKGLRQNAPSPTPEASKISGSMRPGIGGENNPTRRDVKFSMHTQERIERESKAVERALVANEKDLLQRGRARESAERRACPAVATQARRASTGPRS